MNFNIQCRRWSGYKSLSVEYNGTTIELGFLDESERKELAYKMREAALELDNGEAKEYVNPGLEKALEIVKDYLSDLKADKRINEALWVDVVREHLEAELED